MDIKNLPWDSSFFGSRIGSVKLNSPKDFEKIISQAQRLNYKCLYIETPLLKEELILEYPGADIKLLEIRNILIKKFLRPSKMDDGVKTSNPAEAKKVISNLKEISKQIATESRFYKDQNLRSKSKKLYQLWVEKNFLCDYADKCYFFLNDSIVKGFITSRLNDQALYIDLLGVHKDFRGTGIGSQLLRAVENWGAFKKIPQLKTITQGTNSALQFYQKNGFIVTEQKLLYHAWIK